jgi:hypothetical protein
VLDEPAYEVTVLSEAGGLVSASAGIRIDSEPFGDAVFDTVMFASGVETDFASPALRAFVKPAVKDGQTRRGPMHWSFCSGRGGCP